MQSLSKRILFIQVLSHGFLRARHCSKSSVNIGGVLSLSGEVRKGFKKEVPLELVLKDE